MARPVTSGRRTPGPAPSSTRPGRPAARPRVAACLIVRNERTRLARCLRSLNGYVDEVVVLDTGSDDGTPDLARGLGARVAVGPWTHDFSHARNRALALTDADWALWIDADEALEPMPDADPRAWRDALARTDVGGWEFPIFSFTGPKGSPDALLHHAVRLFRRDPKIAFEGRVHEQIAPSIVRAGYALAPLPGLRILHWGYQEDAGTARAERNLALLQAEVQDRPDDAYVWFHLAGAFEAMGRDPEAEFAARRAFALAREPGVQGSAAVLAASALLRQDQPVAALEFAAGVPEAVRGLLMGFLEATAHLRTGDPATGLSVLRRVRPRGWDPRVAGDVGVAGLKSDVLEAQLLVAAGRPEEAFGPLDAAEAECPGYPDAAFTRGVALALLGRRREAADALAPIESDPRLGPGASHLAAQALFDDGDYAGCAARLEATIRRGPCRDEVFVLLARARERLGDPGGVGDAFAAYAAVEAPPVQQLVEWARVAAAQGDGERALQCALEALRRGPGDAEAHFICADLLHGLGLATDAAHLYEAGLRLAPANAPAWQAMAACLREVGLDVAAERAEAHGRWTG